MVKTHRIGKMLLKEDKILIKKILRQEKGMMQRDCLQSSQQTLTTHNCEASAAEDRRHHNGQKATWQWTKTKNYLN